MVVSDVELVGLLQIASLTRSVRAGEGEALPGFHRTRRIQNWGWTGSAVAGGVVTGVGSGSTAAGLGIGSGADSERLGIWGMAALAGLTVTLTGASVFRSLGWTPEGGAVSGSGSF
ncbi:MAG: hypothetical protein EXR69_15185 [Myxococcales bacterium]|nr:hypothetical protein [Myxococcales bacterium]